MAAGPWISRTSEIGEGNKKKDDRRQTVSHVYCSKKTCVFPARYPHCFLLFVPYQTHHRSRCHKPDIFSGMTFLCLKHASHILDIFKKWVFFFFAYYVHSCCVAPIHGILQRDETLSHLEGRRKNLCVTPILLPPRCARFPELILKLNLSLSPSFFFLLLIGKGLILLCKRKIPIFAQARKQGGPTTTPPPPKKHRIFPIDLSCSRLNHESLVIR